MSVNLKSLQIVIDLARRKRDQSGAQVASAQRELGQVQDQLSQLTHFADDGQTRWMSRAAEGVSTVLMQHQKDFTVKIQHAIDFQLQVVGKKQARLEATLSELQASERALATLEKVAERTRSAHQLAAGKAEQKLNDEMAMAMLAHQRRQTEQENAS